MVDFNCEDWWAKLLAAGFDPALPTLFTWEGVVYYLADTAVDAALYDTTITTNLSTCNHKIINQTY